MNWKKKIFSESSNIYPLFFTIVFILIMIQYSFSTIDAIFYDLWVKFDFGMGSKDNIVLISLDEESDEFLGESYPYTYATHVRFLKKLTDDHPAIINYFITLSDAESSLEKKYRDDFLKVVMNYKDGQGHFRFATSIDYWGEQIPPDSLRPLGYSLAQLNIDNIAFARDDVCRRAILNISGEDSLHLWTANQYRKMHGEKALDPNNILGSYYSREADATFTLFRYFTSPIESDSSIITIPFHRVVVGNFPKDFFKDKIVLVGSKYPSSSSDFILTPFNKDKYIAPQLNVHAAIIQSILQDKTVLSVPTIYTDVLSILIALILSYIISRLKPTRGLTFTMLIIVFVVLIAFLMFAVMGLWFNLTHMILTIFVVYYIWVPFRAIGEYQIRYAIEEESKLLKQVDALKQNFISFMSHDLKTPVAKIAGIADILLTQYSNTDVQDKHLNSIVSSTKDLNKFITSILDLTKIESHNLNLIKSTKDINKMIEAVIESLRFEASSSDIKIITDLSPLYPITIDVNLINRVISNLIENAIKYAGLGAEICISTWDDEKWVYLEIKDNGIGISENDLQHVFGKFYRVKNDSSHSIKGSGLGLYLVKYFIELHDGEITVSSKVGEGTTFLVKLRNA